MCAHTHTRNILERPSLIYVSYENIRNGLVPSMEPSQLLIFYFYIINYFVWE